MSSPARAQAALYLQLESLAQEALNSLRQGLDLDALSPLFERKAALSALIAAHEPQGLKDDPEGLQALLAAQEQASRAESELAQVLQVFVSSYGTRPKPGPSSTGQRWDQKG